MDFIGVSCSDTYGAGGIGVPLLLADYK